MFYWISVIVGTLDFDFLDFDIDLDAADQSGPFYAILAFLNVAELPFMLVFSIWMLNFWIVTMMMYYLPITAGGAIQGILLLPALIVSMIITKFESKPLKGIFKYSNMQDNRGNQVIKQLCVLICDVNSGRIGQAEIKRDGAPLIFNVKSEYDGDSFVKGEVAFVNRKDTDKNIYYIVKFEE
ncbi:hypothetical protein [Vallitalea okinawensis]|uniref:hypothetical protein n=1 Tax=Vallitalea okinawensis TaxID=2078660 RepID=UPI00130038B3|nr:hypothetical protein [Vallitalea okinawensis]